MLVSVRDIRLFVERVPAPAPVPGAPSLIAVHGGLGFDHTYFRSRDGAGGLEAVLQGAFAPFSDIIYVDLRGHGRSTPVRDWSAMTFDTLADDLWALRQALGVESMVLLGHSFGGYLAQHFALRYPEALTGLVLCATAPAFDYATIALERAATRATPVQMEALLRGFGGPVGSDAAFGSLVRRVLPLYFHTEADRRAGRVADRMQVRAAAFNHGQSALLPAFDTTAALSTLSVPTLCLGGAADWITPPAQGPERLAALLPGATLRVLEDCGHFPFLERPAAVATVLRSWAREHVSPPLALTL
jgi:proline iminopeptidase